MCGGFVAFYAGQDARGRGLAHLAYNGGRLVSYALLGALAGWLGAGLEGAGARVGVTRASALLAGALMVAWGLGSLAVALGARLPRFAAPSGGGAIARALRALHAQPAPLRALALGLLTTLLPCGFLWIFVAAAGATASPGWGALVMLAFWAGTVPIMAGLGLTLQMALGPLRRRLPAVTALALVVLGLLTMAGRVGLPTPLPRADCCAPARPGR
jgi:uncharacterized protein